MNASEERALATRLGKVDRRAFIPFVRVVPVHVDSGTLAILYQDARAGRGVHREVCALESEISQSTFEARSSTSFQRVARALGLIVKPEIAVAPLDRTCARNVTSGETRAADISPSGT